MTHNVVYCCDFLCISKVDFSSDGNKAVTDDAISSSSRFILSVEGVWCTPALFYTRDPERDVGSWMSIVVVLTSFVYDGMSFICN